MPQVCEFHLTQVSFKIANLLNLSTNKMIQTIKSNHYFSEFNAYYADCAFLNRTELNTRHHQWMKDLHQSDPNEWNVSKYRNILIL